LLRIKFIDMKVIALVNMNGGKALVFDKEDEMIYKRNGNIIYGFNGFKYNCYEYQGGSQAFAGREFDIELDDGEVVKCKGDWWHAGVNRVSELENVSLINIASECIESLKKCYVFCGGEMDSKKYQEAINNPDLPVYDYWDYEKVIKFDGMRKKYIRSEIKLQKAKESLTKEVKRLYKENKQFKKA
jgi:hypothetical protein